MSGISDIDAASREQGARRARTPFPWRGPALLPFGASCVLAAVIEAVIANQLTSAGINDPNRENQTITARRALAELNRIRVHHLNAGERHVTVTTRRTPLQASILAALDVDTHHWDRGTGAVPSIGRMAGTYMATTWATNAPTTPTISTGLRSGEMAKADRVSLRQPRLGLSTTTLQTPRSPSHALFRRHSHARADHELAVRAGRDRAHSRTGPGQLDRRRAGRGARVLSGARPGG